MHHTEFSTNTITVRIRINLYGHSETIRTRQEYRPRDDDSRRITLHHTEYIPTNVNALLPSLRQHPGAYSKPVFATVRTDSQTMLRKPSLLFDGSCNTNTSVPFCLSTAAAFSDDVSHHVAADSLTMMNQGESQSFLNDTRTYKYI